MTELRAIEPHPIGEDVVEVLEEMLARARTGDFSSVVVVALRRDGESEWSRSRVHSWHSLTGAVAAAQHTLMRQWMEPD
jgi:hypothetical protein